MSNKPKVRLAPSPTGDLHIGTARTGLFNYLFAKKEGGEFILRIEDTDKKRSKKEYEENILSGLKWLGLDWDGEPVRQSKRMEEGIYSKYLDKLIKQDLVYSCYCTAQELEKERERQLSRGLPPRYSGKCLKLSKGEIEEKKKQGLKPTMRLNVSKLAKEKDIGQNLEFKDLIRGKITSRVDLIGDFILVKKDKTPLYHFAVVIDDKLMDITHVIRGEDHITNTFNQLLLYKAFGWQSPKFAHLPLILSSDGSKLSKRKGNIVSIEEFKDLGYLPKALVNYMTLLGWGIKGQEDEIFSMDKAIAKFRLDDVNSSGATFETEKLDYINGHYIRQKTDQELLDLLKSGDFIEVDSKDDYLVKVISLVKERMRKLSEFSTLAKYFFTKPDYQTDLLVFKKSSKEKTIRGLKVAIETLDDLNDDDWKDLDKINQELISAVKEAGLDNGDLFWPVRAALSGREASPSPGELIWVMGKAESIERLTEALEKLS